MNEKFVVPESEVHLFDKNQGEMVTKTSNQYREGIGIFHQNKVQ